jgi:hypothetical protein
MTRVIGPGRIVVLASALGGQVPRAAGISPTSVPLAQWVAAAPDCHSRTEIEVRTAWYTVQEGKLTTVPSQEIAFSLAVY